jgi:hypothetical protein
MAGLYFDYLERDHVRERLISPLFSTDSVVYQGLLRPFNTNGDHLRLGLITTNEIIILSTGAVMPAKIPCNTFNPISNTLPVEIEQIHQATLEVLATAGCRMPHARVQALLKERGAQVDEPTGVIHFPPELIERALREVKKEEHDPKIKPFRRRPFTIHPCNEATIIDYQAKSRRPGTTEDVIKGIVVATNFIRELDHAARHPG